MRFYNRLLQTNIRCNKGLTFISFAVLEGDFVPPPCSDLALRYGERQMSASQVLRILFLLTTSTLPCLQNSRNLRTLLLLAHLQF